MAKRKTNRVERASSTEVTPDLKMIFAPKNDEQKKMLEAIASNVICFCTGPAGTGKSYLSMAFALTQLLKKSYERIVLTRAALPAVGENLGWLKGSVEDKTEPFFAPLFEIANRFLGPTNLKAMMAKNSFEAKISIIPFSFMRGHSISNSVIICDEAQNATIEQIRLLLTRISLGSKLILVGDPTQSDLRGVNGMEDAIQLLDGIDGITHIHLSEQCIVRHPIIKAIEERYNERNKARQQKHV